MDFYLSYNNGAEQLRLPVIPSNFEVSQRHNNTVVNITNLGEMNLIGKTALSSMTITSFFPAQEYYFCKYTGFPSPYDCVKLIQAWKSYNKPIRVIVTETNINYAMTIENFTFAEKDGTGDVYFTLELKEYVFIKSPVSQQVVTTNGAKITVPPTKRETKPIPKIYKVKKGESMAEVAKKTTGSTSNAKSIAKLNKVIPQHKGMDLVAGRTLLI